MKNDDSIFIKKHTKGYILMKCAGCIRVGTESQEEACRRIAKEIGLVSILTQPQSKKDHKITIKKET